MFKIKKIKLFTLNFLKSYSNRRNSSIKNKRYALIMPQTKVYRLTKADPRYKITLSVCDRFDSISGINFKDQNHLYYTISQTKSIFAKELILFNLSKKRQFFTFMKEVIQTLGVDILTLSNFESFNNKQNIQILSPNFFIKEKIFLNYYYYRYLNVIGQNNLITFIKPSIGLANCQNSTTRLVSNLPTYLNALNLLDVVNTKKSNNSTTVGRSAVLSQLNLIKSNLHTFYVESNIHFTNWFSRKAATKNFKILSFDLYKHDMMNSLKHSSRQITSNFRNNLRKNRFKEVIKGRNYISLRLLSHYRLSNFNKNLLKIEKHIFNKIIWKNNNYINFKARNKRLSSFGRFGYQYLKRNRVYSFTVQGQNLKKRLVYFTKKQHNLSVNTPQNLLYLLFRLEEKIDLLPETALTQKLIRAYNLIKILLNEKHQRSSIQNGFLINKNSLLTLRKTGWKPYIKRTILNLAKKDQNKAIKILSIVKKLFKNINTLKVNTISKIKTRKVGLNLTKLFKIKKTNNQFKLFEAKFGKTFKKRFKRQQIFADKIRLTENYTQVNENRNALGLLINKKINFFFINALALTKYAYNVQRKWDKKPTRSPNKYLQNLDRDLINRYKYVAIYIKDFIRVCFIGMFLKNPTFISRFIAFLISELPRNRKETTFLKCVMKIVRIFSAERGEIIGLRIKFKGRVNRWRRTKSLIGKRGHIAYNTLNKRIIYGTAHAINRKGAIGIGLWIYYKPEFTYQPRPDITFTQLELSKESILNYIKYSQKKTHYLKNYSRFQIVSN